jgi:hypothetical protein
MLLQGLVGRQTVADGAYPSVRCGRGAELMVSEFMGRYHEATSRGQVFSASTQAAIALSTLSTTATGFILSNPLASGFNLSILDICVALATAPAAAAPIHLAANAASQGTAVVHTTPLTVVNNLLGSTTTGVGLADRASTLPATPTVIRAIGGGPVAASSISPAFIRDEVAGQVIVGPGCNVSLGYLTTAISAVASMAWAELAV